MAKSRFDYELDFDLIEADIWELNSLEKRYGSALQRAKEIQGGTWNYLLWD